MVTSARNTAQRASNHPLAETGARVGYAGSGVLHLLIAWLAVQLALGGGGESTDQKGALRELAEAPAGAVLLWVILVGFVLLGLLQVAEGVAASGKERLKPVAKGVVYLALAVTTWSVLQGASSKGDDAESATEDLLSAPGGALLVGAIGLGIVAVGVYHVIKGVTARFREDLEAQPRDWVLTLGRAGYTAKGVALGVVGGLFVSAAVTHDADKAGGLDGAIRALLDMPAGPVLVVVVALGLACYGAYAFARARFGKV